MRKRKTNAAVLFGLLAIAPLSAACGALIELDAVIYTGDADANLATGDAGDAKVRAEDAGEDASTEDSADLDAFVQDAAIQDATIQDAADAAPLADAGQDSAITDAGLDAAMSADAWGSLAYRAAVLADVPTAYWRFGDPPDASVATDETSAHDGVYKTVVLGAPGPFLEGPSAMTLDGTPNAFVSIPGAVDFSFPMGFTIEAWVRPTSIPAQTREIVHAHGNTMTSINNDYDLNINHDNTITIQFYPEGGPTVGPYIGAQTDPMDPTNLVPVDGFFHQMVGAFDHVNQNFLLFIDGALVKMQPVQSSIWSGTGVTALAIGPNFVGTIADVSIYPLALSADRVLAHYNAALGHH